MRKHSRKVIQAIYYDHQFWREASAVPRGSECNVFHRYKRLATRLYATGGVQRLILMTFLDAMAEPEMSESWL